MRNRVDLPEPLAPSRATLSPSAICSESPRRAGMRSYSKPTSCNSKSSATRRLPSHPDRDTAGTEECEQPNIVPRAHTEIGEDADLSPKAARLHRKIDVVAEGNAFAEQNAGGPGGNAALFAAWQPAHRAALARFQHLARGFDQKKDVAMRHGQHRDDFLRQPEGTQRLQHVRPRSTQYQQRGEGHRGLDAREQQHSSCHTLRGDVERPACKSCDCIARSYEDRWQRYDAGEGQNDQPYA